MRWPATPREGPPQRPQTRGVPEDAVQAADQSLWIEPLEEDEWPHRELRLGFDTQARFRDGRAGLPQPRADGHPRDAGPSSVLGASALNRTHSFEFLREIKLLGAA